MDKVKNFDNILLTHTGNEVKLDFASQGFGAIFDQIPLINLLAAYLKSKFENVKDIKALNRRDTAQTIIRLAKKKNVILPQEKADLMLNQAIELWHKHPDMIYGYGVNGTFIGLIGGALGAAALATIFKAPGAITIGSAILGGIGGAAGGWKLGTSYGSKKVLPKDKYHIAVEEFLRKKAEVKKKFEYSDYDPQSTQALASVVSAIGGTGGSMIAGEMLRKSLNKPGVTTKKTVRRFLKENKDINVTFSPNKARKGMNLLQQIYVGRHMYKDPKNPFYLPSKAYGAKYNFINSPVKNLDVAMHELGHAKDFKKTKWWKYMAPQIIAPMAGAAWTYKALQDEDTVKYAPAGAVIGMAPTLLAEAQANRHAFNAIKKFQGRKDANKFLRTIVAKNTGSYWAFPAALGVGSYLAGKLIHKNIKHEERKGKLIPFRNKLEELKARVDRHAT